MIFYQDACAHWILQDFRQLYEYMQEAFIKTYIFMETKHKQSTKAEKINVASSSNDNFTSGILSAENLFPVK
jgi:uncharacterized protein YrzB (UPF0473 family)